MFEKFFVLISSFLLASPVQASPLSLAIDANNLQQVQTLLKNGVNQFEKNTALLHASKTGRTEIIRSLLENGAQINALDMRHATALIYASSKGHTDTVKILLSFKPDIQVQDQDGNTAFMYAYVYGYAPIAQLLLESGSISQDERNIALRSASQSGFTDLVTVLLNNDALVNSKNELGQTPLMMAITGGREAVAKLLIERGADVNAHDRAGRTPLMYTITYNNPALTRLLLSNKADMNATDAKGWTALRLARQLKRTEIANVLSQAGAK